MMAYHEKWSSKYSVDPLNALQPSEETGPGSHFVRAPESTTSLPRRSISSSHRSLQASGTFDSRIPFHPTLPTAASARHEPFPSAPSYDFAATPNHQMCQPMERAPLPGYGPSTLAPGRPRRASSLSARFPGDQSHRPLSMIRHNTKLANRAPHLRKSAIPGPDTIDTLDNIGMSRYHHEGPYDATLLARNLSPTTSPVAALQSTNAEALRATPSDMIKQSLDRHRPLDGVAAVPPGALDFAGNRMQYQEGADLMIEDGASYKRWPGVTYLPGDLKGKGEPAFSVERAMHQQNDDRVAEAGPHGTGRVRSNSVSYSGRRGHRGTAPNAGGTYELQTRSQAARSGPRSSSETSVPRVASGKSAKSYGGWERETRERNGTSSGSKIGAGIRRGLGSLRRRKQPQLD